MTQHAIRCDLRAVDRPQHGLTWLALLVAVAAPFMAVVDGFIVLLAAPSIQRQLHASDASVQLIVAGYVAAYASLLVAGGRLGDRYGRRRLFVIGTGLFTAFSLACALAPDEHVLVVARCLQGGSAALMYPQSLALIRVNSEGGQSLARAMGVWGIALGVASIVAQLLGGLLVQADVAGLGWRAVFAVNVPLGVAVICLAGSMPESRAGVAPRLDLTGMAMLSVGLFALVLPLTAGRELGWPWWTWPLLGCVVAVWRLYTAHERRLIYLGGAPLLALDLFQRRTVATGLITTLALYGGQLSLWVLVTWYLQRGLGLAPFVAGAIMAPAALGFFAASTIVSRLPERRIRSVPAVGALLATGGAAGLAGLAAAGGRPATSVISAFLLLTGSGFGATIPTLVAAVLSAVRMDREGVAAGVLVTVQQAAAAGGVAISGALLAGLVRAGIPYTRSIGLTLLLDVALFLVTAVMARTVSDASAD